MNARIPGSSTRGLRGPGDAVTVYADPSSGRRSPVSDGAELVVDTIAREERLAEVLGSRRAPGGRAPGAPVIPQFMADASRAATVLPWCPARGLDRIVESALAWERRRSCLDAA